MKAYKHLKEEDGTILWSDSCAFDRELRMEKIADIFYSDDEDSKIMDAFWVPPTENSISDSEDDVYFDASEGCLAPISQPLVDNYFFSHHERALCSAYCNRAHVPRCHSRVR